MTQEKLTKRLKKMHCEGKGKGIAKENIILFGLLYEDELRKLKKVTVNLYNQIAEDATNSKSNSVSIYSGMKLAQLVDVKPDVKAK